MLLFSCTHPVPEAWKAFIVIPGCSLRAALPNLRSLTIYPADWDNPVEEQKHINIYDMWLDITNLDVWTV